MTMPQNVHISYRLLMSVVLLMICLPTPAQARRMSFRPTAIKSITKAIHTNTRQIFRPSFTIRSRYAGAMNSGSFSSDGEWFVTAGASGAAQLWSMTTGQQEMVFSQGSTPLKKIAFLPGRNSLLSANSQGQLILWDIGTNKKVREIDTHFQGKTSFLAITPFAARGQKSRGLKFTTPTGTAKKFTYGGQFCLAPSSKKEIGVWDVDNGKKVRAFSGHSASLTSISVAQDGLLAASGDSSGKVVVWNWQTGTVNQEFMHRKAVTALALSSNGSLIAIGYADGDIHCWLVAKKKKVFAISGHDGAVTSIRFSPNITAIASAGEDKTIKIWSAAQGTLDKEMSGHEQAINDLQYAPSGQQLLSCSTDKTSRFWDTVTGKEMVRLVSMRKGWAAVSPTGYFDGTLDGQLEDRLDAILWTVGKRAFNVDGFIEGYYRPALLGRIFAGQDLTANTKLPNISEGFNLPPRVRITSPAPDSGFSHRQISVEVEATDEGGGINAIRLFHNKKIIPESMASSKTIKDNGAKRIIKSYTVTLADQENHFRAVGLDDNRIESEHAEIAVQYQGTTPLPIPALHLFIVGINKYQNPALNLNFGVPDAMAVTGYFTSTSSIFTTISKTRLFDSEASQHGINHMLATMAEIPAQDSIILYFAGHGETVQDEWFFIPYDLSTLKGKESIRAKGISSKKLQESISSSQARRVLLLLDACKSGAAMHAFSTFEDQRPFALLSRATGIHIAAASTSQQYASELEDLGHGIFTFTLLTALQGKADLQPTDGRISVLEVLDYINREMPILIKKHNTAAQRPISSSRGIDFRLH